MTFVKAPDLIDRLIESLTLVDYSDSIIFTDYDEWIVNYVDKYRTALIKLVSAEVSKGKAKKSGTHIIDVTPTIKEDIWLLIKPPELGNSLRNLTSLMTYDLKKLVILNPLVTPYMTLTYYALSSLRAINKKAATYLLTDFNPRWKGRKKFNLLTYLMELLERSLANYVIITPYENILRYYSPEEVHEAKINAHQLLIKEFSKIASELVGKNASMEDRIFVLTYFKTESPEVFKDLKGVINFAKYVSWSAEFHGRHAYLRVEGPSPFAREDSIEAASRAEGWANYMFDLIPRTNYLQLMLLESASTYMITLYKEVTDYFAGLKDLYKDLASYTAVYKVMRSWKEILSSLG